MTTIWNKQKDNFYNQIFRLVLPIIIQNLLSAAVSSADVVMLNYVGQSSISAVSLASQYASVLFMVFLWAWHRGDDAVRAVLWKRGYAHDPGD